MTKTLAWAVATLAMTLTACGDREAASETPAAPAAPSSATLAQSLDGSLGAIVDNAGLQGVFEGVGPYTIFAPSEAALAATGSELSQEANRAAAAALVRAHIVPGAITRSDIAAALDGAAAGDTIEMRTMADGVLTFARDGETIVVSTPDGARANLVDQEAVVSNGVVQPIDAALTPPPPVA